MDPVRNPFAPGAGNPPPELAGRSVVLADIEVALQRIALGKPAQSSILVGLRGVGKTVLLVRVKDLAERHGFRAILCEAHEGKNLPELLVPPLRSLLFGLSAIEAAKERARRGLRVLKSFVNGLKIKVEEVDYGLTIDPEFGTADSGDLEADLPNLMLAVAEAAQAAGRPVAILIDELQYLSETAFSSLIMSVHKINQSSLPLIMVGAGLPQILGLAGESKSYAERLFRFPKIGALEDADAIEAIVGPATDEGVKVETDALAEIIKTTQKYPYFLQQWGHDAWNAAEGEVITLQNVQDATLTAIRTLDESFFRVRFDRCTNAEKRYMRALAELGEGAHRSGDVAEILGVKTTSVGPVRGRLITKGMIYSPQHGDTAFTVPLFDAYMRRVMPTIERG